MENLKGGKGDTNALYALRPQALQQQHTHGTCASHIASSRLVEMTAAPPSCSIGLRGLRDLSHWCAQTGSSFCVVSAWRLLA